MTDIHIDVLSAHKQLHAWYTSHHVPQSYRLSWMDITDDIQYLRRVYGHMPILTYVKKRIQLTERAMKEDTLFEKRKARQYQFIQPRPQLLQRGPKLRPDIFVHTFVPPWLRQNRK